MPGEWRPYFLVDTVQAGSSSTATLSMQIGATEEFMGTSLHFESDSTFSITKIYDSAGIPYGNMDATNIIASTAFQTNTAQDTYIGTFPVELQLVPNTTLKIDVTDTSASANDIWVVVVGKIRTA